MNDDELRQENAGRLICMGRTPPWYTRLVCDAERCKVVTYLYGSDGSCPGCGVPGTLA